MKQCPHCFEDLKNVPEDGICPFCSLSFSEKTLELDYPSLTRKKCFYCGKSIAKEAHYCRYWHKWVDEVERRIDLFKRLEE